MKKYSYKEVVEKIKEELNIEVKENVNSPLSNLIDAFMVTVENENGISEEVMFEVNLISIINYVKTSLREQMTK